MLRKLEVSECTCLKQNKGYRPIYCDKIRISRRMCVCGGGGGRGWEDEGVKQFFLSVGSLYIF